MSGAAASRSSACARLARHPLLAAAVALLVARRVEDLRGHHATSYDIDPEIEKLAALVARLEGRPQGEADLALGGRLYVMASLRAYEIAGSLEP